MVEFFTIKDWDETEQIEYFENPIYSYLNEDEKKQIDAIHPEIKENENKKYNNNNQEIITLANQLQRHLHTSSPDGEPSKFEINKKPPIPEKIKIQIDDKFLTFYKSLKYDNYKVIELRDNYNKYFGTNYTKRGFGQIKEVKLLFTKKRIYINSKKRSMLYTKLYSLSINNQIT